MALQSGNVSGAEENGNDSCASGEFVEEASVDEVSDDELNDDFQIFETYFILK